jgi:hypothetical protein
MAKVTLKNALDGKVYVYSKNKEQSFGVIENGRFLSWVLENTKNLKSATRLRNGEEELLPADVVEGKLDPSCIRWCDGTDNGLKSILQVNPLLLACPLPFKAPKGTSLDMLVKRSLDEDEVLDFEKIDGVYSKLPATFILPREAIKTVGSRIQVFLGVELLMEGEVPEFKPIVSPKKYIKLGLTGCSVGVLVTKEKRKTKRVPSTLPTNRFHALANDELLDAAQVIAEHNHPYEAIATVHSGITVTRDVTKAKSESSKTKINLR